MPVLTGSSLGFASHDLMLVSRRPCCISHLTVPVGPGGKGACDFGYEIAACSWLRDVMPSFGKIRYRWALTVRCEM